MVRHRTPPHRPRVARHFRRRLVLLEEHAMLFKPAAVGGGGGGRPAADQNRGGRRRRVGQAEGHVQECHVLGVGRRGRSDEDHGG